MCQDTGLSQLKLSWTLCSFSGCHIYEEFWKNPVSIISCLFSIWCLKNSPLILLDFCLLQCSMSLLSYCLVWSEVVRLSTSWSHIQLNVFEKKNRLIEIMPAHLSLVYIEGSRPEWCISSMIYSRDTPFWSGTLDMRICVCHWYERSCLRKRDRQTKAERESEREFFCFVYRNKFWVSAAVLERQWQV